MLDSVLNMIQILGIGSLGSLVTLVVQHFLARRSKDEEYRKNECKEAFSGFLSAFSKYEENIESIENKASMELWAARVKLVSSRSVYERINQLLDSKPKAATISLILQLLIIEMRKDIGVSK